MYILCKLWFSPLYKRVVKSNHKSILFLLCKSIPFLLSDYILVTKCSEACDEKESNMAFKLVIWY